MAFKLKVISQKKYIIWVAYPLRILLYWQKGGGEFLLSHLSSKPVDSASLIE
jgi:hypothetical protein